jgi:ZIP family zinc transporter
MAVIFMSVLAGVVGTGLGGLFSSFAKTNSDKTISVLLSFAGGVMTSIVFFELIPEAEAHGSSVVIITGIVLGVVLVLILNHIIDHASASKTYSKLHQSFEEFFHEEAMVARSKSMMRSGVLMFFVIGLHNIPEGLAIGAAGNHDIALGYTLALMIGLHNIPEGMAIGAPLVSGGLERWKSVLLTITAGSLTVLGAVFGILLGSVSDTTLSLSYAIAGGAMLYAVFGEILPQSINMSKSRIPTVVLLVGVIIGYLLKQI